MLVGNKSDLRQDGIGCVPTSYGEKLAMVITNKKNLDFTKHLHLPVTPPTLREII